jgi:glycosyltransferase involved in cell wall biosynthesis
MRVLFISKHFPDDLSRNVYGVQKRMCMFIDAIKEIASLDMLFYVPDDMDISPPLVSKLERSLSEHWNADITLFLCPVSRFKPKGQLSRFWVNGVGVFSFFRQPDYSDMSGPQQIRAFENCLVRRPDAIFVHRLHSMCPTLLTSKPLPPIFFDLDDIEHILLKRNMDQMEKLTKKLLYLQVPAVWWGEYRAIRQAKLTFVCSEQDRNYLTNRWNLPGVVTIPNAVTIPELQPLTQEPTLLFIGSDYKPNIDAAELLIRRIWPRVYQDMPMARLIIAGVEFPNKIRNYCPSAPGVEFTGFVHDLGELYRRARIICAPILSGSGTRVKIIEAAAYGKPIVATSIGAEGINMRDGCELLLRDDPESFATACINLLKDPILAERLGSVAREAAIRYYDRTKVVRLIQSYLEG